MQGDKGKGGPGVSYEIKQCDAPCQGYISKEDYQNSFRQALDFLGGHYDPLLKSLEEKMQDAAERMDFEKAIEYRELLNSVKQVAQKQKITSSSEGDRDILAMARDERDAVVQVFFIRGGELLGLDHFPVNSSTAGGGAEILESFIKQFCGGAPFVPRAVWPSFAGV